MRQLRESLSGSENLAVDSEIRESNLKARNIRTSDDDMCVLQFCDFATMKVSVQLGKDVKTDVSSMECFPAWKTYARRKHAGRAL